MADFEQYENLPGVKVSYEDGNLYSGHQTAGASTQSILIIGTATDGPVGEPVSVNAIGGPRMAERMFGGLLETKKVRHGDGYRTARVPHQGTLVRSMWEAIRSGNEDVRLLRVSGKTAKTEILAQDPDNEITQPLVDSRGNQFIPGNVAFSERLRMESDHRLIKIESIEEFEGEDTTVEPLKVFPNNSGYASLDTTPGYETVYFSADRFNPNNTIKINYKATDRTYTEVTRDEDGVRNPSTKGVLTQDTVMTNYFSSEVGNWSDDPKHQVLVYVVDSNDDPYTIPSVDLDSGKRLWRIGKEDDSITDPEVPFTAKEFSQGGIRFTEEYMMRVAQGIYPSLDSGVDVRADYFHYSDVEIEGSHERTVPGTEKVTTLNFIPDSDTLEIYYELGSDSKTLELGVDYTLKYPENMDDKVEVRIAAGAGPVGARLFAHYETGKGSLEDAKLIVNAKQPGEVYGRLENIKDLESLEGVKVTVEYDLNPNGTVDMENRVIRFIKPVEKRNSAQDIELVFRTKTLDGIYTIREFVNHVNGHPNNNIVRLDAPTGTGSVALEGLMVTDHTISPIDGRYDYRPINLGEKYNENSRRYELHIDHNKEEHDISRFLWIGSNGFYDKTNMEDMRDLYEQLGGTYELIEGTFDQFDLVNQGIYERLENYSVDIINIPEVNANTAIGMEREDGTIAVDQSRNFATQLAQHCAMVTAKAWETIGVIGIAPAPETGLQNIQRYVDLLTGELILNEEDEEYYTSKGINPRFTNIHTMYNLGTHENIYNDDGEPIDIGRYINVVFGPEVGLTHERLGNYVANGSTMYSALVSNLNPEIATTNERTAALGVRYDLSESQHNQLAGGRYVAFDNKITMGGNRAVTVKDGVTAAMPNSDYQRLSTVRITHATVQLIRQRADKFIGLPNGLAQRNALATEIQAGLDRLKEIGVLQNFEFSIFSSKNDRVLGNAFITLELVPAFELRKIYTSVALRASL